MTRKFTIEERDPTQRCACTSVKISSYKGVELNIEDWGDEITLDDDSGDNVIQLDPSLARQLYEQLGKRLNRAR